MVSEFLVVSQDFSPCAINLPEKFKFLHLWRGFRAVEEVYTDINNIEGFGEYLFKAKKLKT